MYAQREPFWRKWGWRLVAFGVGILCLNALVLYRLYDLSVLQSSWLENQGKNTIATRVVSDARADIMDREGRILATSILVKTLAVNTAKFIPLAENIDALAEAANLPVLRVKSRVEKSKTGTYFIKRHLTQMQAQAIEALDLAGIELIPEYKRFYPLGQSAGPLIGLVDIDGNGQEGIERSFTNQLASHKGSYSYAADRRGRMIGKSQVREPWVKGKSLRLTIDAQIQEVAFDALVKGVKISKALAGSSVVMEVESGDILAAATFPSYNPNNRKDLKVQRNRVFTDMLEPGSTMKPFTVVSGLLQNNIQFDQSISTSPGFIEISNGRRFADLVNLGTIKVPEILIRSSQVGTAKIALGLDYHRHLDLLANLGFGTQSFVGFPEETSGFIPQRLQYSEVEKITLGFGHGIAVSLLQLAQAYSVLARDGQFLPANLLHYSSTQRSSTKIKVLDEQIASQIKHTLETAVNRGTGRAAKVRDLPIGGKTGTSHLVGNGGYEQDQYRGIFVGFFPVDKPKYVIAVSIEKPDPNRYYGGQVAAPIFADIAKRMALYYDLFGDSNYLVSR